MFQGEYRKKSTHMKISDFGTPSTVLSNDLLWQAARLFTAPGKPWTELSLRGSRMFDCELIACSYLGLDFVELLLGLHEIEKKCHHDIIVSWDMYCGIFFSFLLHSDQLNSPCSP